MKLSVKPRDRRRDVRVRPAEHEPVEVQVMGRDFMDVFRARDISVGGIGLLVPHLFDGCDLAVSVDLVISVPGRTSFMARGVIRHISKPGKGGPTGGRDGFGVEFTFLSVEGRAFIQGYVQKRVGEGGEDY